MKNTFDRGFETSDENCCISMNNFNSRIQTSLACAQSAIQVWKNDVIQTLDRADNKLTDMLRQEKCRWRKYMVITMQEHSYLQFLAVFTLSIAVEILFNDNMNRINLI